MGEVESVSELGEDSVGSGDGCYRQGGESSHLRGLGLVFAVEELGKSSLLDLVDAGGDESRRW